MNGSARWKTRKADVRIIAATSVDLLRRPRLEGFREDLFYRLNVVEISYRPYANARRISSPWQSVFWPFLPAKTIAAFWVSPQKPGRVAALPLARQHPGAA